MQNRNRLTNILIAGTLTVLVLTIFLAFRGGTETAVADTADSAKTITPVLSESVGNNADVTALQAQIDALQTQNQELLSTLSIMQEREATYQAQIESANETIQQLSAQANTVASGSGNEFSGLARPGHSHDGRP